VAASVISVDAGRLFQHSDALDELRGDLRALRHRIQQLDGRLDALGIASTASVAATHVGAVEQILAEERLRVRRYLARLMVIESGFVSRPAWERAAWLADSDAEFLADRRGRIVARTTLTAQVDVSASVKVAKVTGRVSISYTETILDDGTRVLTVTDGAGVGASLGTPEVGTPGTPSAEIAAMLMGRAGRSYVVTGDDDVRSVLLREALLHQARLQPQLAIPLHQLIDRLPAPTSDTVEVEVSGEAKADLVYSEKSIGVSFPWIRTVDHHSGAVTTEHGWMTTGSVLFGAGTRVGSTAAIGVHVAVTRDKHGKLLEVAVTEIRSAEATAKAGTEGSLTATVTTGVGATSQTEWRIDVHDRPDLRRDLDPLVDGFDWDLSAVTAVARQHGFRNPVTEVTSSTSATIGGELPGIEVKATVTGERDAVVSDHQYLPGERG
jgi:hypothetical protein